MVLDFTIDFLKRLLLIGITVTVIFVVLSEAAFFLIIKLEFDTQILLSHSAAFTYATTDENLRDLLGTMSKQDAVSRDLYWTEFNSQVDRRLLKQEGKTRDWFSKPKLKIENSSTYSKAQAEVTVQTDYVYQGSYLKKLNQKGMIPSIKLERKLDVDLDYRK